MNMQQIVKILCGGSLVMLMLGLNGCSSTNGPAPISEANPAMPSSPSFASSAVCANNPFLQKYQCSFIRVEQAARTGDPDAQYALGYLYYYGIGTTQDRQTGLVWIRKAAAQGQTVAQDALKALSGTSSSSPAKSAAPQNSGGGSTNSTSPASTTTPGNSSSPTTSAPAASTPAKPDRPLTDYLPNYGEKRVDTTSTPPMVNLSAPPAAQQ